MFKNIFSLLIRLFTYFVIVFLNTCSLIMWDPHTFKMASRDNANILEQIYEKITCSDFYYEDIKERVWYKVIVNTDASSM